MEPGKTATDENVLLQSIIGRIPTIKDPDQLRELVGLAIDMTLRRAEDHPLRDQLAQRAGELFATPAEDYSVACIELLLAAKEHRPARQVLHAVAPQAGPAEEDQPPPASTSVPGRWVKPAVAAVAVALLVAASAWLFQMSPAPETAEVAAEPPAAAAAVVAPPDFQTLVIEAAKGVTQPVRLAGVRLYVLRGADGGAFVRAEGVPPALCVSSGLELARQGVLTIDAASTKRVSRMALGNLCRRSHGPVAITWRPAAS